MANNGFQAATNRALNAVVVPMLNSPLAPLILPLFTTITYTGRRSGKTFSTPVYYRRRGQTVLIRVAGPDAKQWWRNLLGDGGPIRVQLPGGARNGHAIASRDDAGRVTVRIALDPEASPQ